MIIGITGAPSVGKTTQAKLIAKELKLKILDVKKFAKLKKCISGKDKGRNAEIIDEKKLEKELNKELKKKKNLVLESHLLVDMKLKLDYLFILRASPLELFKRLKKRKYKDNKAHENALTEALNYFSENAEKNYLRSKIYEISTIEKTKEEVAKLIINTLKGKKAREKFSFEKELEKLALMEVEMNPEKV